MSSNKSLQREQILQRKVKPGPKPKAITRTAIRKMERDLKG
jgi:hypothetical protein